MTIPQAKEVPDEYVEAECVEAECIEAEYVEPTSWEDRLPFWLHLVFLPLILLASPILIWVSLLLSGALKVFGASETKQDNALRYAIMLVLPTFILVMLLAAFAFNSGSSFNRGSSGSASVS